MKKSQFKKLISEIVKEEKLKLTIQSIIKEELEEGWMDKLKGKKIKNPDSGREIQVQTALSNDDHPAHDKAVAIANKMKDKDEESGEAEPSKEEKKAELDTKIADETKAIESRVNDEVENWTKSREKFSKMSDEEIDKYVSKKAEKDYFYDQEQAMNYGMMRDIKPAEEREAGIRKGISKMLETDPEDYKKDAMKSAMDNSMSIRSYKSELEKLGESKGFAKRIQLRKIIREELKKLNKVHGRTK